MCRANPVETREGGKVAEKTPAGKGARPHWIQASEGETSRKCRSSEKGDQEDLGPRCSQPKSLEFLILWV